MSVPSTDTFPSRNGTRPISDFIRVDLPIPLRPITATISFGATAKSSPCSTSL